jgi:hypothetical protein
MLKIIEYQKKNYHHWNNFIEKSNNGTIFHRLDFLSYHGKKFQKNANHLLWLKGTEIYAVMPLGILPKSGKKIALSPFGASWGGLVTGEKFKLKYVFEVVESLVEYLKRRKISEILITPTPMCYFRSYSSYFDFVLSSLGFKLINREVLNVTKLPKNSEKVWERLDKKCRNQTRSALKNFTLKENVKAKEFYPILIEDKHRHGAEPTHSLEDLEYLERNLSRMIRFDVAQNSEGQRAGIGYFISNASTLMTFYMAQEDAAMGKNGLNALVLRGIERAVKEGFEYLDFGISSRNNQPYLGLAEFKENFSGFSGFTRDTYQMKLK